MSGEYPTADDEFASLNTEFQPESLTTWAKRASLVNGGMKQYRESILKKLIKEGYDLDPQASTIPPSQQDEREVTPSEVKAEVKETQQENYQKHCQEIAEVETPSDSEQAELERKQAKTKAERQRERKGQLVRRYGEIEVTPELVERDDQGWYAKLRRHYFLTVGAEFLTARDRRSLLGMVDAGNGAIFKPDVNKRLRGAKNKTLELINLEQFLDPEQEFTSESLAQWQNTLISQRYDLKTLTGIAINPDREETPIQLAQRFLSQLLGLRLECIGKRGERGNQIRVYRGCSPNPDGRQAIFEQWRERDLFLRDREEQAASTTAPSEKVTNDPVATLSINTYLPTQRVDTKRVTTDSSTDSKAESQDKWQASWTPQRGEEVLVYAPLFENNARVREVVWKIAAYATDCWEVLVDGVVWKIWCKDCLFPVTDKGFDSV